MSARKILFVDDNPGVLKTAELLLRKAGYDFRSATHPAEAYSQLAAEPADAIFLDLNFSRAQMSGEEGLACLREIRRTDPHAVVLVVTGHSGLTVAVQALRAGAHDFIMKPWNDDRLLEALEDALRHSGRPRSTPVSELAQSAFDVGLMVGECGAMVRTKELAARYATLNAAILVMGESGTGKTLLAQALHRQSARSVLKIIEAGKLALSELSELEDATVILENVDELDPAHGASLTAWIQQAGVRNARVVATTCRQHPTLVLPRPLLYALSTLEIVLPPLRDRGNDIDLLANHFARVFALRQGLDFAGFSAEALAAARGGNWPDNLHALRRAVERGVISADGGIIMPADLDLSRAEAPSVSELGLNLDLTEKYVIEEALSRHSFNISKAANELGVTRQTLYRRMARHGL